MPLSDVYLRKLKIGDKPKHADGGGLYLFLSSAGGMLWRMDYRFEGKRKTLSFGSYPAVSLKDARKRREEAKAQLAAGIDPSAEKKRVKVQAAITSPAELGYLLRAIDAYQGEPSICHALRVLPYVFVRSGELRGMTWEEVNLDAGEWVIPAGRMKMRRPHVVPLARQVVRLLQSMRDYSGTSAFVFPGTLSATRCISDMGLLNALRRMGYGKEQMTVHGFRTSASTLLNEQGYNRDWIEAQLAHAEKNAIRDAYNRAEYIPERRKMMQEWADYLDGLKAGA